MGMELRALSKNYAVRALDSEDIDRIFELSCKNELYYQYHPPFVTRESIIEDMKALPPGKTYEDKYYIGFFEGDVLVAMMDLILGYPSDEIAFIGLFMTNVQYQNKGVGSQVIREVCDELKQLGYQKVRLGVDKGNPQSHAFWKKNGFSQIAETQYHVMELAL